ncbi:MAG: hypothetical protein KKD99_04990, partial [Proteobacteria bacterium]|nr:hypothetical protein [Pseudomonadota bacterium]
MKNIMHWALLLAFVFLAANCGAAREQIRTQSLTEREGVFQEVTTVDEPPPGFADVVVRASLKTHLSGEGALLECKNSPHGGPFYHFTLNIDGQAVTWKVPGLRENLPVVKDRHSQDEGDGMKYGLEKRIRLRAGTHRIFFDVPEENYAKTVTVNLQDGKSSTLEFQPTYPRYKWGHPAFRLGFLGFNALFN